MVNWYIVAPSEPPPHASAPLQCGSACSSHQMVESVSIPSVLGFAMWLELASGASADMMQAEAPCVVGQLSWYAASIM